jgi:hypothetical protein
VNKSDRIPDLTDISFYCKKQTINDKYHLCCCSCPAPSETLLLEESHYSGCCRKAQTEAERALKLLGSKFIKQAGSDSVDSSPKAEP